MKSSFSNWLSLVLLVASIAPFPGYAQVTIVAVSDSDFFSPDSDVISESTGVIPIGTADDGSATTYQYEQVDFVTAQLNGSPTTTIRTIEATLVASASGFQISVETESDSTTVILLGGCDPTSEDGAVCTEAVIAEAEGITTTVVTSSVSGSASTLVIPAASTSTSASGGSDNGGGNNDSGNSPDSGNNNNAASASFSISMIDVVIVGILSRVLIL
ncbi:hypothetical protein VKT23_007735 [Stygiomarasmius scandens]|uniref:Uncharacterized protein n=1 Tax=Marasmiellus scandens TaxID=2682957 RepID=A0ABR1JIV5_9AGAR